MSDARYVSDPVVEAQYTRLADWVIFAIKSGVKSKLAPVPHVAVPAIHSASVASSTLPATVVLAFACVLPDATALHAPPIY